MKSKFTLLLFGFIFCSSLVLRGNGVAIINGTQGIYLQLNESLVDVKVNNQIAVVTSRQVFYNQTGSKTPFRYGFPLRAQANAIDLTWYINGKWHSARISKGTQSDSIPGDPGESLDTDLLAYLGETPLLFTPADSIDKDSSVIFIIKYVELLPYSFGKVNFSYPGDYRLIQPDDILQYTELKFTLESERIIETAELEFLNAAVTVDSHQASIVYQSYETIADADFNISYQLASHGLGVFSLSTYLPDSLLHCDELGKGFVSLIIEPESNANTEVIEKNFSLIIDRSGSMSGDKIVQAKDAASFIVNHLNFGDYFNIIDFSTNIKSLFPEMIPYSLSAKDQALSYIDQIDASGSTNISGALTTSIQQFLAVDTSKANIIIFFTDGMATAGITDANGILDAVETVVQNAETEIFLFPFGIGGDVDKKLLSLLALENNGVATFLEQDEVEEKITEFFLTINNPVLLNTEFKFVPDLVHAVYPEPLPNLYKGQQLILSGRYDQPGEVMLQLSGKAFNLSVDYSFLITLVDSNDIEKSFLPKIWAKQAIDDLTIDFHLASSEEEADAIQAIIDSMSICYGVISSEFTSFEDGGDVVSVEFDELNFEEAFNVLTIPNPFSHEFTIHFNSRTILSGTINIMVLDNLGKQVAQFEKYVTGDRPSIQCAELSSLYPGTYYLVITSGADVVVHRIVKI